MSAITRSTPLAIALGSLFLQGVGLIGVALWLVWLSLTEEQSAAGAGFAEAAIAAGVAALVISAARTMSLGRPGMRGLAVFLQLLLMVAGYYLSQADAWGYAFAAWAWGLLTAGSLLAPSAREALGVGVEPSED
ncbi:Integral membrane protein [Stackebrandtia soli]